MMTASGVGPRRSTPGLLIRESWVRIPPGPPRFQIHTWQRHDLAERAGTSGRDLPIRRPLDLRICRFPASGKGLSDE